MLLPSQLDRRIQKRLTWGVAQDPVQGLGIMRKQGLSFCSPMTECPVKSLQGIQQDDTTFPALLYTPPLIESLANRPALLQDLPAWVSHSLFNSFPHIQEDPHIRVSPWETGRTCNGRRDVMSAFDALNVNISTFLRTHSAH